MNKLLKFEEFVNERLFQKSMDRISSNRERLEDKIPDLYKKDNIYKIEGFDGFYALITKHKNIMIYHLPDKKSICRWSRSKSKNDNEFNNYLEYINDEDMTEEEIEIVNSEDFYYELDALLRELDIDF